MFEEYVNLSQIEEKLSSEVEGCDLLCEIQITYDDFVKLEQLVQEKFKMDISLGTKHLKRNFPISFAAFFVWEGIYNYSGGDYWSAISEVLDTDISNWQSQWGEFFLNFLNTYNLRTVRMQAARRYITPILLHGGIPLSCSRSFISHVVWPSVEDGMINGQAVEVEIATLRNEFHNWELADNELQQAKANLETAQSSLSTLQGEERILKFYKQIDEVTNYLEENQSAEQLPESVIQERIDKINEIQQIKNQMQLLLEEIQTLKKITEKWDSQFFDSLLGMLEELEEVQNYVINGQKKIDSAQSAIKADFESIFGMLMQEGHEETIRSIPDDKIFELEDKLNFITEDCTEGSTRKTSTFIAPAIGGGVIFLGSTIAAIILSSTILWLLTFLFSGISLVGITRWHKTKSMERELEVKAKKLQQECELFTKEINQVFTFISNPEDLRKSFNAYSIEKLKQLRTNIQEKMVKESELVTDRHQYDRIYQNIIKITSQANYDTCLEIGDLEKYISNVKLQQEMVKDAENRIAKYMQVLNNISAQKSKLEGQVNKINEKLVNIGSNVENGLKAVDDYWKKHNEKIRMEKELQRLKSKWPSIANEIKHEKDLETAIRINGEKQYQLKQELIQKSLLLEEKEEDMKAYFPVLQQVEEPVKRFLVQGGDVAVKQVTACVAVLNEARNTGELSFTLPEGNLPHHILRSLRQWWDEFKKGEGETGSTVSKHFKPVLCYFEPGNGEIKLRVPAQQINQSSDQSQIILKLFGTETVREVTVTKFKLAGDLVELNSAEMELTQPEETIDLKLLEGENTIYEWKKSGISALKPFMVFDYHTNRLITSTYISQRIIWLIIPNDATIKPHLPILEEVSLYGGWIGYKAIALSTENRSLRTIKVIIDQNIHAEEMVISSDKDIDIALVGSGEVNGVTIMGEKVYSGSLPLIQFSHEHIDKLRNYRIAIRSEIRDAVWYFDASVLEKAAHLVEIDGKQVLGVDIADFIQPAAFDVYQIFLRGPGRKKYVFDFAWVEHLDYRFDQQLYPPAEKGAELGVILDIIVPPKCSFSPLQPAEVMQNENDLYRLSTHFGEDFLRGRLGDSEGYQAEIRFKIPKVKWRLLGRESSNSDWYDTVEEVWIDEISNANELYIVIKVPEWMTGSGRLLLNHGIQEDSRELKNGTLKFELLRYSDTLAALKNASHSFSVDINITQGSFKGFKLMNVKTKWIVRDVAFNVVIEDGQTQIAFSWTDHGQPSNRVMQITDLRDSLKQPSVNVINDGDNSVGVRLPESECPFSLYKVRFYIDDPWISTTTTSTDKNENVFITQIINNDYDAIRSCSAKWISQDKLFIQGKLSSTNKLPHYLIEIIALGIDDGKPVWESKAITAKEEHFEVELSVSKRYIRWIAITSTIPNNICWVGVLDTAPLMEMPLSYQNVAMIEQIGELVPIDIRLISDVGKISHASLGSSAKEKIIQFFGNSSDTVEFYCLINGDRQKLKFIEKEDGFKLCYNKGVVCTTCGQIFPDQQAWYDHNPRGKCRSLRVNVDKVDVQVVVVWDYQKVRAGTPPRIYSKQESYDGIQGFLSNNYQIQQDHCPTVISDLYDLVKNGSAQAARKLVNALWERELDFITSVTK